MDKARARSACTAALLAAAEIEEGDARVPADLEERIERVMARARAAWPEIRVPELEFAGYIGARVARSASAQPLAAALDKIHVEELYLACGCARGDRAAIEALEKRYLSALPGVLRRVERSPAAIDDLCQVMRQRLLVGERGGRPRILEYAGQGSLAGWLRVSALRLALNEARAAPPEQLNEDHLVPDTPGQDPELVYLKQRYRAEFAAAFQEALAGLDAKARTILRLHYIDGLNIDRIGALHNVHRSTAARWIATYCREVQEAAHRHLARMLRASPAELDSIARLVGSQLELSIRRALGHEPTAGSG